MNSKFLQEKFMKFLSRKSFDFGVENIFLFDKESDILAVKDRLIHEFEFKVGSSDFRKDFKKKRHSTSTPNFFYYVVSDISIINGDYLEYAGIYVHSFMKDGFSKFNLIKPAIKIRESEISIEELYSMLKKTKKLN